MEHLDAKAIRERLNSISLALAALEDCCHHPNHTEIASAAAAALAEIAVLVTNDELEEHGAVPLAPLRSKRQKIRSNTAA